MPYCPISIDFQCNLKIWRFEIACQINAVRYLSELYAASIRKGFGRRFADYRLIIQSSFNLRICG
jgi:hypothetical protein